MKVGLIGINSLQEEQHFVEIKNALQNNLSAIYSPNPADLIPISRTHNIEMSKSASELFDNVDAVYIANSLKLNYTYAIDALKKSRHLFVDDISELTIDEVKQLYKLAAEGRTTIQLKLSLIFAPEYIEIKESIYQPKLIEINKSYPTFIRQKDYFSEILNLLNFAGKSIKSSIKKIATQALPISNNHFSLISIHISYDNGAILNIKLNNLSDEEETVATFHENDRIIQIDFHKHYSIKQQFIDGALKRNEYPTNNKSAFHIEMLNFLNSCENPESQSISDSPTELKTIQATYSILEQIKQSNKTN